MLESLEMLVTSLLFPMTQVKSMDSDLSIDSLFRLIFSFFFHLFFCIIICEPNADLMNGAKWQQTTIRRKKEQKTIQIHSYIIKLYRIVFPKTNNYFRCWNLTSTTTSSV